MSTILNAFCLGLKVNRFPPCLLITFVYIILSNLLHYSDIIKCEAINSLQFYSFDTLFDLVVR